MTQPSGRVCGVSARFRTYLRASPIFCIVDTVLLLIRLVLYRLSGLPLRLAAREVKNARFDEAEVQSAEGGFQALQNLTFVRWLLFGLGTLPQAVKLIVLGNVPWTKVWGLFFLSSFLVLEVVFWMASGSERGDGDSESYEMVERGEQQGVDAVETQVMRVLESIVRFSDTPLGKVKRSKDNLAIMDRIGALLATVLHNALLMYALHQLWHRGFDFTGTLTGEIPSLWVMLSFPVVGVYVLAIGLVTVIIVSPLVWGFNFYFLEKLPAFLFLLLALLTIYFCVAAVVLSITFGLELLGHRGIEILTGWVYEMVVPYVILAFLYKVGWRLFDSQPLRLKLGLLDGERCYRPYPEFSLKEEENEIVAVLAFLGFVATLMLCVCWYGFRFNPAETCNPGLTGVFG